MTNDDLNRRCETEGCQRETDWQVDYPVYDGGTEDHRFRAMCDPCKRVFLSAVGRALNEVTTNRVEPQADQEGSR